jgi:hypothetical protein
LGGNVVKDLLGGKKTLRFGELVDWADGVSISFQCRIYEANGGQVHSLVPLDLQWRVLPGPKRKMYILPGHDWGGR